MADPAAAEAVMDQDFSDDSLDEWEAPIADDNLEADVAARQQDIAMQAASHVREEEAEKELAGDEVLVTFHLPDGRTDDGKRFFMGQTVEVLKMYLDNAFGLTYESTSLYLGDLLLMDPLSLVDLPFVPKTNNTVTVKMTA